MTISNSCKKMITFVMVLTLVLSVLYIPGSKTVKAAEGDPVVSILGATIRLDPEKGDNAGTQSMRIGIRVDNASNARACAIQLTVGSKTYSVANKNVGDPEVQINQVQSKLYTVDTANDYVLYTVVLKNIPKTDFYSPIGIRGIAWCRGAAFTKYYSDSVQKNVVGVVNSIQDTFPDLNINLDDRDGILYKYAGSSVLDAADLSASAGSPDPSATSNPLPTALPSEQPATPDDEYSVDFSRFRDDNSYAGDLFFEGNKNSSYNIGTCAHTYDSYSGSMLITNETENQYADALIINLPSKEIKKRYAKATIEYEYLGGSNSDGTFGYKYDRIDGTEYFGGDALPRDASSVEINFDSAYMPVERLMLLTYDTDINIKINSIVFSDPQPNSGKVNITAGYIAQDPDGEPVAFSESNGAVTVGNDASITVSDSGRGDGASTELVFDLPNKMKVTEGESITVTIKGTWSGNEGNIFRTRLCPSTEGNDRSTGSSGWSTYSTAPGNFEANITITATADATALSVKSVAWNGPALENLKISEISVVCNDRADDSVNITDTTLASDNLVTNGNFANGVTGWTTNIGDVGVVAEVTDYTNCGMLTGRWNSFTALQTTINGSFEQGDVLEYRYKVKRIIPLPSSYERYFVIKFTESSEEHTSVPTLSSEGSGNAVGSSEYWTTYKGTYTVQENTNSITVNIMEDDYFDFANISDSYRVYFDDVQIVKKNTSSTNPTPTPTPAPTPTPTPVVTPTPTPVVTPTPTPGVTDTTLAEGNLVVNGNFANGVNGWTTNYDGNGRSAEVIDNTNALLVANRWNSYSGPKTTITGTFNAGDILDYQYSIKRVMDHDNYNLSFETKFQESSTEHGSAPSSSSDGPGNAVGSADHWVTYYGTYTVQEDTNSIDMIIMENGYFNYGDQGVSNAEYNFYIDDVQVVKRATSTPTPQPTATPEPSVTDTTLAAGNLVVNGNFANGVNGWTTNYDGNGRSAEVTDNTNALLVANRWNSYSGPKTTITGTFHTGDVLKYQYSIKRVMNHDNYNLSFETKFQESSTEHGSAPSMSSDGPGNAVGSADHWVTYYGTYTVQEDTNSIDMIIMENGYFNYGDQGVSNAEYNFYIDDVQVLQLSASNTTANLSGFIATVGNVGYTNNILSIQDQTDSAEYSMIRIPIGSAVNEGENVTVVVEGTAADTCNGYRMWLGEEWDRGSNIQIVNLAPGTFRSVLEFTAADQGAGRSSWSEIIIRGGNGVNNKINGLNINSISVHYND